MSVLSDGTIVGMQLSGELSIVPFVAETPKGVISFGLTSAGYDLRLAPKYKVFTNARCAVVDPKHFDPEAFVSMEGPVCTIPPNSFMLGMSMERMRIPRDVIGVCLGKSTYARCGIIVCATPLEPEWEGNVTIEVSNTTPLPAVVYAGEGIMQVLLLKLDQPCFTSYKDKAGKYQDQTEITLPRV